MNDLTLNIPQSHSAFQVADIRCAACALKIERALVDMPGVDRCRTNLPTRTVVIDYHDITEADITQRITELGYTPVVADEESEDKALTEEARSMLMRLGVAGIGMMQVMMYALATYVAGDGGIEPAYEELLKWAGLAVATPVAFYSAQPFYQSALRDLKAGGLGMDVPVSIAIVSAYILSTYRTLTGSGEVYFDSVCMFAFLLLVGRFLELRSRRQYQDSLSLSDRCLPVSAILAETGERVKIQDVIPGTLIKVEAGETLTVDGVVVSGTSSVSEAAFTGESMPITKGPGSKVLAGAENLEAQLVIETSVPYEEFVIKKMSDLYQEAALYKPAFSILADKIARYFVGTILTLAALTGLGWYLAGDANWFVFAITVLVVSCPCALSLATPVAYTVALSALRRNGVVVSTGRFLEKLAETKHVVFDKTGTLTRGQVRVTDIRLLGNLDKEQVMQIAAALEKISKHPIARAFEQETPFAAAEAELVTGQGVKGLIDGVEYRLGKPSFATSESMQLPEHPGTWVLLAGPTPLAWINLSDEIREEAPRLIQQLKGYGLTLLTGDSEPEAARVGHALGIEKRIASATPEDKVEVISNLQQQGDVLMIGDGVNDAAAMARAHTSIAVNPVDIAVQEAAEATLVDADISKISTLLHYANRARGVIRQNISWAVLYNLSVIPLAAFGLLEPWMAALGMSISSLLVVANANRLHKVE